MAQTKWKDDITPPHHSTVWRPYNLQNTWQQWKYLQSGQLFHCKIIKTLTSRKQLAPQHPKVWGKCKSYAHYWWYSNVSCCKSKANWQTLWPRIPCLLPQDISDTKAVCYSLHCSKCLGSIPRLKKTSKCGPDTLSNLRNDQTKF